MNEAIDIEGWRRDGEQLWASIQETKLVVVYWNNPWPRFAVIGALFLIAAVTAALLWQNYIAVAALTLAALPCVYTAIKYYRIGAQTGGLYSFFSENGFGIGCHEDRLSIPYSSIRRPARVTPSTVNDNYIVLPVAPEKAGVIVERQNGTDSPWDGTPYQRGIASILLENGELRARAYPNEMIVHLFCGIYPLCIFLESRPAEEGRSSKGKGADLS